MKRLRWEEQAKRPLPKHPYRDTVVLYAILAGLVVGVTALTGGDVRKSVVLAVILFVGATAYSWWRWRERIRRAEERQ
jgi:uncharacterized membrane protein